MLHALGLADTTVSSAVLQTHYNTYLSVFAAAESARTGPIRAEAQRSIERARTQMAALEQLKARARESKLRTARSKLGSVVENEGSGAATATAASSDSAVTVKAEPNATKRKRSATASAAATPASPPSVNGADTATSSAASKKLKLESSSSSAAASSSGGGAAVGADRKADSASTDSKLRTSGRKRKHSSKLNDETDSDTDTSIAAPTAAGDVTRTNALGADAKPVDPAKCYVCEKKDQRTNLMHCRQCKRGMQCSSPLCCVFE